VAANDESILKRLEELVPSVDAIARALQVDHETAKRLYQHNLLRHAALVEYRAEGGEEVAESPEAYAEQMDRSEDLDQIVADSSDALSAESDLVSSQRVNMSKVEDFAEQQAGAATVTRNARRVHMVFDDVSIQQVLEDFHLPAVTKAARRMKLLRIRQLIDALMDATEGR
jgi:DNA-binding transcriptional regulator YhcF (GntR family)